MQITVIGAGNIGSIYGGHLARSGADVTLVDVLDETVARINADGLRLEGVHGELTIDAPATTDPAQVPPSDVAIIAVLGYQTRAAAETARRVLKPNGFAVTFQNGLGNLEVLQDALGVERVVGGLTYHSADTRGPGHIAHTKSGPTYLGELDGSQSERVEALRAALETAGMEPAVPPDIHGRMWQKFAHNCALNALCSLTQLRPWHIQEVPELDGLQTLVVQEVLALAAAMGVTLAEPDPLGNIKQRASGPMGFNRPSMMQHIARGLRTEIDTINGYVASESPRHGLAAPYNDAVTRLIKGREHPPERPSPD